ncbi:hypothetical protein Ssi02_27050 [Sinosporangium siamense]|uniref:Uncharacterized protein n=1 Tax=Sinosporangium siamense TaxID=1367973 RepID=A0A919RHG4_9ACTN|nr:hypothetical protein Ssi02_27050 [Sinosporangium siamense]
MVVVPGSQASITPEEFLYCLRKNDGVELGVGLLRGAMAAKDADIFAPAEPDEAVTVAEQRESVRAYFRSIGYDLKSL